MGEEIERLRGAVTDLKAKRQTSRDDREARPAQADAAPPARGEIDLPVVVVSEPPAARREAPRSLLALSTLRSRHFRILR